MARADCTDFALTINDLVNVVVSRGGVSDLAGATKKIAQIIDNDSITRETVRDSIIDATSRGPRDLTEGEKNIRAIRREAPEDKKLDTLIKEHDESVARGEEPTTKTKAKAITSDIIKKKRAIRNHQKKSLANSDKAKQKRVKKQIADMEAIIEKGDFAPKIKPKPTPKSKELETLEFKRDELRRKIRFNNESLRPVGRVAKMYNSLGLGRAFMTGLESSAVLRQGGAAMFAGRKAAFTSIVPSVQAAFSKKKAFQLEKRLREQTTAQQRAMADLKITESDSALTKQEEELQSTIIKYIPGLAGSARAYTTYLNYLRAGYFDAGVATLGKSGEMTLEEMKTWANWVNISTGRGRLPGDLERAAKSVNAAFFAARYVSSRFQGIAAGPVVVTKEAAHIGARIIGKPELVGGSSRVRRQVAKEYLRTVAGLGLFYSLASLWFDDDEMDIEWDPRSSDFGKLRFGNTRLDPMFGLSQTIVFVSRLASRSTKSAQTQNIHSLTDGTFGAPEVKDIIFNFQRSKLAPIAGTVFTVVTDSDFIGDKPTPLSVVMNFAPMTWADIFDASKEEGLDYKEVLGTMAFFGMGLQTYGEAIDTKDTKDLIIERNANTYKETRTIERGGKRVHVLKGQPHVGQEGRVAAIKAELESRKK